MICQLLAGAGAQVLRAPANRGASEHPSPCDTAAGHGAWSLADDATLEVRATAADVVLRSDGGPSPGGRAPDSAVVVTIEADSRDAALPHRSHELVAQVVSGAVFEHMPNRPSYVGTRLGRYGAGINTATAIVSALIARLESGLGTRLFVSRSSGAKAFMTMTRAASDGAPIPVGADVPLFQCADDRYVCLSTSPRATDPLALLAEALELDIDPQRLRGTRDDQDLSRYYYNSDVLEPAFGRVDSAEIISRLQAADFAVELVRPPVEVWDTDDVAGGGLLECCDQCGNQYVGMPIEGL